MALHQFDYVFAIAMLFAFLDAWNIGANDVANSFATSVSSRALTYPQAMLLAAICEFLGAVLAGSRVSDTIRNKIIDVNYFQDAPATLMLLMACALVGSSTWLTLATRLGAPVSTTHSIVGGIIGAGIAAAGAGKVHWGWSGFSKIIASWFISPGVAGSFAAVVFLITKYGILKQKDSYKVALYAIPFYCALTAGVLIMVIVWKGAPNLKLDDLSTGQVLGAIFGGAGCAIVLYAVFWYPFLYRKLVLEDWTMKPWDFIFGPLLFRRPAPPPLPEGKHVVLDYYRGVRSPEEVEEAVRNGEPGVRPLEAHEIEASRSSDDDMEAKGMTSAVKTETDTPHEETDEPIRLNVLNKQTFPILIKNPKHWPRLIWLAFIHGVTQDVVTSARNEDSFVSKNVKEMHARAEKYNNKTEHVFALLQGMTAGTASFAHGSNDISNAAGPLSTIYLVWSTNTISKKASVPVWVLVYTASALVIGLWTYGYHLMKNLGNNLTLQSPARGFTMELGAAITVVFATRLSLPISTTQCLVGAVVFVGLCNGDVKSVNWRMVLWSYCGWFITVPCAGLIAGIIMGIIINAPHLGVVYTME